MESKLRNLSVKSLTILFLAVAANGCNDASNSAVAFNSSPKSTDSSDAVSDFYRYVWSSSDNAVIDWYFEENEPGTRTPIPKSIQNVKIDKGRYEKLARQALSHFSAVDALCDSKNAVFMIKIHLFKGDQSVGKVVIDDAGIRVDGLCLKKIAYDDYTVIDTLMDDIETYAKNSRVGQVGTPP